MPSRNNKKIVLISCKYAQVNRELESISIGINRELESISIGINRELESISIGINSELELISSLFTVHQNSNIDYTNLLSSSANIEVMT